MQSGLRHCGELVKHHAMGRLAGMAHGLEPACPCARARLQMQQRVGQQAGRRVKRRTGQTGRADRHHDLGHQRQVMHAGPVLMPEVDCRIERAGPQREGLEAGGEVHRHFAVGSREIRQTRRQPVHPERR